MEFFEKFGVIMVGVSGCGIGCCSCDVDCYFGCIVLVVF